MSNLIVDFPCRPSMKRVQFSKFSSLISVKQIEDITDDDASSKAWYSSGDYKAMKRETKRAVRDARKALDSISKSNADQDLLEKVAKMDNITLTGIENMDTSSTIKRIQACKARCINAVLDEQDNQDFAGIYDPEKLARISSNYSKSSRGRARSIKKLHSKK